MYDGSGSCQDGFEALTQEDTNGDGVVNALNNNWQNIKIWRDLNQDGYTDDGELISLEELGIVGINVTHDDSSVTADNGTVLQGEGTYVDISGDSHSDRCLV
jgi:hypothetical protein